MTIVRIGVTGHRYLDELDKVMKGVENVIQRILETFPDSDFRVLSSLAEGADQILAKRLLLVPNTHLWVPLPLSEEEYLKDFRAARSKEEFIHLLRKAERVIKLPEMDNREDCYKAAGKYIVKNSNLLIAIWDGKPAQGKGGTAEIVTLTRTRNIPLAYIHAGNRVPGTSFATSLGHEQGTVTFENFPPINRTSV